MLCLVSSCQKSGGTTFRRFVEFTIVRVDNIHVLLDMHDQNYYLYNNKYLWTCAIGNLHTLRIDISGTPSNRTSSELLLSTFLQRQLLRHCFSMYNDNHHTLQLHRFQSNSDLCNLLVTLDRLAPLTYFNGIEVCLIALFWTTL